MLTTVPFTLWIAEAAVLICFLALLAYRAQVTRYEEDQLLSDESGQHERAAQAAIAQKVDKVGPLVRVFGGATALLTLCIVGMYVWDAAKTMLQ